METIQRSNATALLLASSQPEVSSRESLKKPVGGGGDDGVVIYKHIKRRLYMTATEVANIDANISLPLTAHMVQSARRQCCEMIVSVSESLGFPLKTSATAQIYFHRFFLCHSMVTSNPMDTAILCLFVASKTEDTIKKLRYIVKAALEYQSSNKTVAIDLDSPLVEKCRRRIIAMEMEFLTSIEFQFDVKHSHGFVIKIAKRLWLSQDFTFDAWKLCAKVYSSPVVVMFPFHILAAACLMVISQTPKYRDSVNLNTLSVAGGLWFMEILPNTDLVNILEATVEILAYCADAGIKYTIDTEDQSAEETQKDIQIVVNQHHLDANAAVVENRRQETERRQSSIQMEAASKSHAIQRPIWAPPHVLPTEFSLLIPSFQRFGAAPFSGANSVMLPSSKSSNETLNFIPPPPPGVTRFSPQIRFQAPSLPRIYQKDHLPPTKSHKPQATTNQYHRRDTDKVIDTRNHSKKYNDDRPSRENSIQRDDSKFRSDGKRAILESPRHRDRTRSRSRDNDKRPHREPTRQRDDTNYRQKDSDERSLSRDVERSRRESDKQRDNTQNRSRDDKDRSRRGSVKHHYDRSRSRSISNDRSHRESSRKRKRDRSRDKNDRLSSSKHDILESRSKDNTRHESSSKRRNDSDHYSYHRDDKNIKQHDDYKDRRHSHKSDEKHGSRWDQRSETRQKEKADTYKPDHSERRRSRSRSARREDDDKRKKSKNDRFDHDKHRERSKSPQSRSRRESSNKRK